MVVAPFVLHHFFPQFASLFPQFASLFPQCDAKRLFSGFEGYFELLCVFFISRAILVLAVAVIGVCM